MEEIKRRVLRLCLQRVDDKILELDEAIVLARSAQQEDTKSSAGDKFETSREMMTQEIEKNTLLLAEAKQQRQNLLQIPSNHTHSTIQRGSIVESNHGNFYVGVSVGAVNIEEKIFQTISPASPVGSILLGKKAGDTFVFNGKEYIVQQVY